MRPKTRDRTGELEGGRATVEEGEKRGEDSASIEIDREEGIRDRLS